MQDMFMFLLQGKYKLGNWLMYKKNLLSINIVLETIEESQSFTFLGLTGYFDNNIGLFLNMSLMSLYESIYLIGLIIYISITAACNEFNI